MVAVINYDLAEIILLVEYQGVLITDFSVSNSFVKKEYIKKGAMPGKYLKYFQKCYGTARLKVHLF